MRPEQVKFDFRLTAVTSVLLLGVTIWSFVNDEPTLGVTQLAMTILIVTGYQGRRLAFMAGYHTGRADQIQHEINRELKAQGRHQ